MFFYVVGQRFTQTAYRHLSQGKQLGQCLQSLVSDATYPTSNGLLSIQYCKWPPFTVKFQQWFSITNRQIALLVAVRTVDLRLSVKGNQHFWSQVAWQSLQKTKKEFITKQNVNYVSAVVTYRKQNCLNNNYQLPGIQLFFMPFPGCLDMMFLKIIQGSLLTFANVCFRFLFAQQCKQG